MCINRITVVFLQKTKLFTIFLFFCILHIFKGTGLSCEAVCFSSLTHGYWQIWVINPENGKLVQLTFSSQDKKETTWYNNASKFIYRTSNAKFYLFNLKTKKEAAILTEYGNIFDPFLSPDNKKLVFTRFKPDITDNSDLWIFNFTTQKIIKLTADKGLQYDPVWHGTKIVYVSSEIQGHNIKIIDLKNNKINYLTKNKAYNISPDWSLYDKKLVFSSNITGNYEIWTMDINGRDKKRLTFNNALDSQPVWSKYGQIIFVSNRQGNMQIWTMKADGSEQKPLTPDNMICSDPLYIPSFGDHF